LAGDWTLKIEALIEDVRQGGRALGTAKGVGEFKITIVEAPKQTAPKFLKEPTVFEMNSNETTTVDVVCISPTPV